MISLSPLQSDFAGIKGYSLHQLTSGDIPAFIDLGLPTCAFMHGRPETPKEKMRQHFTSFVREYAFDPESEIYVVKDTAGQLVAQLWLHETRNRFNGVLEMWVWDLTVNEAYQRRGLGKKLLEFARNHAESKGCAELWLLVSSINEKAVRLYQSVGMHITGHLMSVPVRTDKHPTAAQIPVNNGQLQRLSNRDIPALYRLWEAAGLGFKPAGRDREDRLSRHLLQSQGGGWGVYHQDTLIAATLFSFDGRKGFIERLAVHPAHQRNGLAKVIVTAALQSLRECDAQVIAALIESENTASRGLFESLGFVDSPTLCYYSIRDSEDS